MTKSYSIEGRLISRTSFLSSLIVIFSLGVIDQVIVSWLKNDFDISLRDKALVMSTMAEFDHEGLEFEFADEVMPEFEREDQPEYFQITLEGGDVFERSKSLGYDAGLSHTQDWVEGLYFYDVKLLDGSIGRQAELVYIPAIDDDDEEGMESIKRFKVSFVLAQSTESLRRIIHEIHLALIVGGTIIVVLIVIILRSVLRSGLNPLSQLEHEIQNLNFHNLGPTISLAEPPKEIEPIVNKLNEAVENISQGIVKERRFIGDVAHELRTPIAELKAIAEVSIKYGVDEVSCEKLSKDVLDVALLMECSINNLLALARSESESYKLFVEDINISQLVSKIISKEENLIREKRIELNSSNRGNPLVVKSGLVELQIILSNIINNALEYSSEDSSVDITVDHNGMYANISVENVAENLEKSDLDCMFDRMWRKDSSRTIKGHVGIGMSLVKAYSDILGVETSIELRNEHFIVNVSGLKVVSS